MPAIARRGRLRRCAPRRFALLTLPAACNVFLVQVIDKTLTIEGSGTASTTVDFTTVNGFLPDADGIVIKNMKIENSGFAIRFDRFGIGLGSPIDNTEINNVLFLNNSNRAIELHNNTKVTNLRVIGSVFTNNPQGIRMASTSVVDGLSVTGSHFTGTRAPGSSAFVSGDIGIYQANDGGTSTLDNLTVTNNTFDNHGDSAIFVEEVRNMLIDNNIFMDNTRGFTLFKFYSSAGVDVEDLTISNNQFNNETFSSLTLFASAGGVMGDTIIKGNTINQDVGVMSLDFGKIDIRLSNSFANGPVLIDSNVVTFSGTFASGAGAGAAYAVKLRGNVEGVTVASNQFDGGGVADGGGAPPISGIYLASVDGFFGQMSGTDNVNACNTIENFINGVSVHDGANFGGLTFAAEINVNVNNIAGNSSFGINNDTNASETIDAAANWWGAADGPGAPADTGSGDAVSANVDVSNHLNEPCLAAPEVAIDIKPGSDPNGLNPNKNGVIPVAILSTPSFDATTVDATTVTFGPGGASPVHNGHIENVDGDGDDDLVLHFKAKDTGIVSGDTEACIDGMTTGGDPIEGCDTVFTTGS